MIIKKLKALSREAFTYYGELYPVERDKIKIINR